MPPLYTDEAKVSQILRNFISNALKFTERGEVRVVGAPTLADEQAIAFSVARHRHRHRARGPRADLPGVHADRQPAPAAREGHRPRPAALPQARRAARRPRRASRARPASARPSRRRFPTRLRAAPGRAAELGRRSAPHCPCWSSRTAPRRCSSTRRMLADRRVPGARRRARCARRATRSPPFRPRAIVLDILLARRGHLGVPHRAEAPPGHARHPGRVVTHGRRRAARRSRSAPTPTA